MLRIFNKEFNIIIKKKKKKKKKNKKKKKKKKKKKNAKYTHIMKILYNLHKTLFKLYIKLY